MRYGIVKGDKVLIDTFSMKMMMMMMMMKGITIHIIDCYIAVIANENSCKIFSLDEHFKTIKKFMNLELIA
jgi:predicted nucleic acid-binding protein